MKRPSCPQPYDPSYIRDFYNDYGDLACLGARTTVADISPVQVRLNEAHAAEYGYGGSVESYYVCDLLEPSRRFPPGSFDTVVCYGGGISYTLNRRAEAVHQLNHVTRPGRTILVSVMSLLGSFHHFFQRIMELDVEINERIVATGDIAQDKAAISPPAGPTPSTSSRTTRRAGITWYDWNLRRPPNPAVWTEARISSQ